MAPSKFRTCLLLRGYPDMPHNVTFSRPLSGVTKTSHAPGDGELYKNDVWHHNPAKKNFTKKCLGKNQICISLSRRIMKWSLRWIWSIVTFLGMVKNVTKASIFLGTQCFNRFHFVAYLSLATNIEPCFIVGGCAERMSWYHCRCQ